MRNFDATLWTEYQKRILHQFFMLELQYNATDRLRITETDIDVWHEGNRFRSRGFKFDNLAGSSSLQVDNLDIDIDDTDQAITQILLGQDVRNTLAILYHGVVASQDVYTGSFTREQAKISALDGYAFIDLGNAELFAKYLTGKFKLIVRDSAGHELVGYIKAAGTGETYGSDILSGFNFTTGWKVYNATITGASTFNISASVAEVYKSLFTIGNLYKGTITATATTGVIELYNSATQKYLDANSTGYFTSRTNSSCTVRASNSSNGASASVAALSAQQVLTPAATGVTIVSAADGTTYNWTSKSSSFDYYDANGYTYEIINEGILPVDVAPSYRKKQVITEEYMRFIVGGWTLQDDNMARLNLTNELVLWNKKCLRQQSSSCQWVFKGEECQYSGSETWCDQSYERCKNLGNQLRFIGARFIPALAKTALWWGRTPNYAE